ncbi:hypothetical protein A0H81_08142 [Grifola frondosa]|uniref:Uncharacterized protein n=1 Tax=Grifola frondosa TaxID=5627 RepID=A0A1C7M531_GRIFR|nr:hypothetical protein A0H81_08142 [Grifola frondosa]
MGNTRYQYLTWFTPPTIKLSVTAAEDNITTTGKLPTYIHALYPTEQPYLSLRATVIFRSIPEQLFSPRYVMKHRFEQFQATAHNVTVVGVPPLPPLRKVVSTLRPL